MAINEEVYNTIAIMNKTIENILISLEVIIQRQDDLEHKVEALEHWVLEEKKG